MRGLSSHLLNKNSCLILDEANYEPRELDSLLQLVRNTGCYLIIIGRMFIKQLEYSVDAVWQVRYDNKKFILEHTFKPSKNDRSYDTVTCEDSTSVASVYSEYLLREIIPVFGRSNFFKVVKKSYGTNNCLLIADRAKFGPELLSLALRVHDRFEIDDVELNLYLPQCFEEVCLDLIGEVPKGLDSAFFDHEEYFEALLSQSVSDWDKSKLTESVLRMKANYDFSRSRILADLKSIVNGSQLSQFKMFYNVRIKISNSNMKVHPSELTKICTGF